MSAGLTGSWLSPIRVQIKVWNGVFSYTGQQTGHAMRLNSQTGTEGSPVFSLNCDRPLHSGTRAPKTVMSTDGQITDGVGKQAVGRSVSSGVGHRSLCYRKLTVSLHVL